MRRRSDSEAAASEENGRLEILFDLDDTLYPASLGLFRLVSERILVFIRRTLNLGEEEARHLQRAYWRRYGTSLYGLMQHHDLDPEPFLEFVHDVPVEEYLTVDPGLVEILGRLPARRHVFTNGPSEFAERVLRALGYRDLVEEIFDIRGAQFVPKPNAAPYDAVVRRLGARSANVVLVDDALKNLPPARERGWRTVWLRQPDSFLGGRRGLSVAEAPDFTPDVVLRDLREIEAALESMPFEPT